MQKRTRYAQLVGKRRKHPLISQRNVRDSVVTWSCLILSLGAIILTRCHRQTYPSLQKPLQCFSVLSNLVTSGMHTGPNPIRPQRGEIATKFVIEIMIEIGMEQTRLYQCTLFHYAEKSAKHNSGTTPADFNHDFKHSGTPFSPE